MAITTSINSFLIKCVRVWHILRKPTMSEFKSISKISSLGILAIGIIGFAVSVLLHIF